MNHKQLHTTLLALCLIVGAVVLSEYSPAALFESTSLREVSNSHLQDISGTSEKEPTCSCKSDLCDELGNEHCVWTPTAGAVSGYCSGCNMPQYLTARFGDELVCYHGKTPNAEKIFGCCEKTCAGLNPSCPAPCLAQYLVKTGRCTPEYKDGCIAIPCYSIRN